MEQEQNRRSVVLCGSMAFFPQMRTIATQLQCTGLEIVLPENEDSIKGVVTAPEFQEFKRKVSFEYFAKIKRRDTYCILVINETKHERPNYIGPNTFAEVAIAVAAKKKVFLLYDIPDTLSEELMAWRVTPLYGDLSRLLVELRSIGQDAQFEFNFAEN